MKRRNNLIRRRTWMFSAFTPEMQHGGTLGGVLMVREDYEGKKYVEIHLDDWQIRELARNCIRLLDQKAFSAQRLAEEARKP